MGNIGSQTGNLNTRQAPQEQWAHSFPRTQPRLYQPKVLPERDARQKLRHTNNGEILQSGGTLTGRQHQGRSSIERENDDSHEESPPRNPLTRTYLSNQRDPLHKSGHRYNHANQKYGFSQNNFQEQMKRFGSEPDLRYSCPVTPTELEMKERVRAKKKYKAPAPPNPNKKSSAEWEEGVTTDNSSPVRKNRLFKTHAETKKNYSSPTNNHKSLDYNETLDKPLKPNNVNNENNLNSTNIIHRRERDQNKNLRSNRLSLPEIKMPKSLDFQEELKERTKLLKTRNETKKIEAKKEKLKTLDHNINKKENFREKMKLIAEVEESKKIISNPINCERGEGSGKESSSSENSPPIKTKNKKEQLKIFYFGMDDKLTNDNYHNDIDRFAANLHAISNIPKIGHSSESDISSDLEVDENQVSKAGIDLQLRPILPKKQLEIPRFSPAAAWRLLSAVDIVDPAASTIASDDAPLFIEDRIEKYSRPPPPTMQIGPRSSNDKSGDSGISGDAGPVGFDDSPENIINSSNHLQIAHFRQEQEISWTPQQDLGDDSSLEEGLNSLSPALKSRQNDLYPNKPHVLSLSLPRDNQLASYIGDKYMQQNHNSSCSSLQKLKRSVSGVLTNLPNKKEASQSTLTQEQNDNWFLSKSAPNSLNNGFNSLEIRNSQKSDEADYPLVSASKHNAMRLIYLPEYEKNQDHRQTRSRTKDDGRERSKSADRSRTNCKMTVYSKSCENLSEIKSCSEPEDLQDPPKPPNLKPTKKPKKFTFQSTVRQIERRRLAEKLSREAEKKERQRLRELEAMQKVEEEFQKKRAREKATIRQQLRLFSMDDNPWSSLPPNLEIKDEVPTRPEPDGAVSSSSASSPPLPILKTSEPSQPSKKYQKNPQRSADHFHKSLQHSDDESKVKASATQVLSEYRQPQREYKDYPASANRYLNDLNENHVKQTTVHPRITCNMPKAKGASSNTKNGTNYRKDFAHGVKSTKSGGSTYSEDSQSQNNSPRMYHNKYAPVTRF